MGSILAFSITSRTSFTPELMALSTKKLRPSCLEIIEAKVVLPTPGGPQRIKEGIFPDSRALRRMASLPTRCSCPTYCSRFSGRSRSAKGICCFIVRRKIFVPAKLGDFILGQKNNPADACQQGLVARPRVELGTSGL